MIQRRTWPFGSIPLRMLIVALLSMLFALVPTPTVRGAEITWVRQFGSANGDNAYAVAADGNVYVAGLTAGALPGQTVAGTNDAFVRKYDADGNQVWTQQFGTTSDDDANGVSVAPTGIFVVGRTVGTFPGQPAVRSADAYVAKFAN